MLARAPHRVAIVGVSVLLAVGCATSTAPSTSPGTARVVVRAEDVPPPPAQADAAVREAWLQMIAGGPSQPLPSSAASTATGAALLGYRALLSGDVATARSSFASALQMDAGLAAAAYGTGLTAEAQGQGDTARQWFIEALRLDASMSRAEISARRLDLAGAAALLAAAEEAAVAGDTASAVQRYRQVSERLPWLTTPYLQLAALQRSAGEMEAALETLETGRRRSGDEAAVLEALAAAYGDAGRWAEASEAWQRLASARPGDSSLQARAADARRRFEEASLPPEYRALAEASVITREQLAAVLAIQLDTLRPPANRRDGVIVADLGERWSTPFVYRMVSWGVMDVYQNNTFWPDMEVRRSMLVESAWRVLQLIGAAEGAPRARIEDPPSEHLLYRPVQAVVGLGLMAAPAGNFDLLAPVSGAEAIEVAGRLAALVRERQQ